MANNVLGGPMMPCALDPLTGFYRDGCCNTGPDDIGRHVVCAEMTADFLEFSASTGNDLTTPLPMYGFEGLKPGDRWCLCASRWQEAYEAGRAPKVILVSTHESAGEICDIEALFAHALS